MTKTLQQLIAEGHNLSEDGGPRNGGWDGCPACHHPVGCDFLGPYGPDGLPIDERTLDFPPGLPCERHLRLPHGSARPRRRR